jgi:surface protein
MFGSCSELKSLDIRNFDVNKVTDIANIFTDSNNIKIIRLDNSDMNTINTLISLLPERNSIGKIYVTGIEDVSGIDKATAASKKWKIVIKENRMNSFIPINLGGKSIRAIYTNNETYL